MVNESYPTSTSDCRTESERVFKKEEFAVPFYTVR